MLRQLTLNSFTYFKTYLYVQVTNKLNYYESASFNDTLNVFYLRIYGVGHNNGKGPLSEKGNLLPPLHGLLFSINSKVYAPFTDRIAHTSAFVTPHVEHGLEREIVRWVHLEGSIRQPIATLADLHLTPGTGQRPRSHSNGRL